MFDLVEKLKEQHGKHISQEIFNHIKGHYRISKHALEQLNKRSDVVVYNEDGSVNYPDTKVNINKDLDNNVLAYYNTDGSVNIAINKWNYYVFAYNNDTGNWTLITYKEESWYGKTIFEKRQMAIDGFDRKYK